MSWRKRSCCERQDSCERGGGYGCVLRGRDRWLGNSLKKPVSVVINHNRFCYQNPRNPDVVRSILVNTYTLQTNQSRSALTSRRVKFGFLQNDENQ